MLRFAPISAEWLGNHRPAKDALLADGATAYYEEQLLLCAVVLPHAVLEVETERARQLERGADLTLGADIEGDDIMLLQDQSAHGADGAESVEHDSRVERSLLYASASSSANGSAGLSARLNASPKRESPLEGFLQR